MSNNQFWENDEDTEKEEGQISKTFKAPKTNAGAGPDEKGNPLDDAKPDSVRLSEGNPPPTIKKVFWDKSDDDVDFWDSPVSKRELVEKFQMFWDEAKKKEQMFWDESKKKEQPTLTERANVELNEVFERKMRSGEESRLDYSKELDKMMKGEAYHSQQDRDSLVQAAFGEITNSMINAKILPKQQADDLLASNIRAGKSHFFRGDKRRK